MIRWSAHLSMLFTEHAPLERPAAARAAGFELVESWWPPADDVDAWVDAVHAAGVGVSCLNADGGDIAAGRARVLQPAGARRRHAGRGA